MPCNIFVVVVVAAVVLVVYMDVLRNNIVSCKSNTWLSRFLLNIVNCGVRDFGNCWNKYIEPR